MSRSLRLQTDVAFDYAASTTAQALVPATETLLDNLVLELTNRNDKALVEGVFSLSLAGMLLAVTDEVSVTINVYRDAALTDLAYSFDNTLVAGIVGTPAATSYQVPILFLDTPSLKSTEDTTEYYITITVNETGATLGDEDVSLTQYTVAAEEIPQ